MCWLAETDRTPLHVLCVFAGRSVLVFFARTRRRRFSASRHETSCMVYISENKEESRQKASPCDQAGELCVPHNLGWQGAEMSTTLRAEIATLMTTQQTTTIQASNKKHIDKTTPKLTPTQRTITIQRQRRKQQRQVRQSQASYSKLVTTNTP